MSAELVASPLSVAGLGFEMFYASSSVEADKLASLALEAATQLDALEHGHGYDIETVRQFGDAIARFSGLDHDGAAGPYWLDPSSSEMFSSALTRATYRSISNVDTLNQELGTIIREMRAGLGAGNSLAAIKKFCLEIHSFILRARMDVGLHERGVFDYDYSHA